MYTIQTNDPQHYSLEKKNRCSLPTKKTIEPDPITMLQKRKAMHPLRRAASVIDFSEKQAPWTRNMSLSMRNLLADDDEMIDPKEEQHMTISPPPTTTTASARGPFLPPFGDHHEMAARKNSPLGHDSIELQRQDPMMVHDYDYNAAAEPPTFPQWPEEEEDCCTTTCISPPRNKNKQRRPATTGTNNGSNPSQARTDMSPQAAASKLKELSLKASESFVAEQEAILKQIQQQPGGEQPPRRHPAPQDEDDEAEQHTSRRPSRRMTTAQRPPQHSGGTKTNKKEGGSSSSYTNLKIIGQERVYAAIDKGTATVVKCLGCAKHMMTTKDIKLVYCPGCGTLSPVSLLTELPPSSRGAQAAVPFVR
jgi:hypothetical protein